MKRKRIVIVRTYSAGCFAGELVSRKGQEVVLANCRRLWSWVGGASLSQLAVTGSSNPQGCKFSVKTPRHELTQAIEVIDMTPAAVAKLAETPEWKA